jgi:RNA polymerase sigma factor (sigma-70 family)
VNDIKPKHRILTRKEAIFHVEEYQRGLRATRRICDKKRTERTPAFDRDMVAIRRGELSLETLITHNRRMVESIARRYTSRYSNRGFDDFVQEGYMALMTAARCFKPRLGFAFSTYAAKAIHSRMQRFSRKDQTVTIPYNVNLNTVRTISMDAPLPGDDSDRLCVSDMFKSDEHLRLDKLHHAAQLEKLLSSGVLEPREEDILRQQYGIGNKGPVAGRVLAKKYGVTRQRIDQLSKTAINKLRKIVKVRSKLKRFRRKHLTE